MAVVVVALDGTRVNNADANTNWANLGGGGPAPAAEPQLKYQGSNAVNRKVTSTTARQGVQYDPGASPVDMRTVTGTHVLLFLKGNIADFGDLNATYGCECRIGSASGAYYHFNMAGSGANRAVFNNYPAQGGYIIASINPNNTNWREGTVGSPDLQNVDYFGFAAQFISGGAKSENLAMDAIDCGRGLLLTRGDGADADGTFQSFVTNDEGTNGNRWGVIVTKGGVIYCVGKLTIGESGTATEFTDAGGEVVIFPDGYVDPGDLGVLAVISNSSTVIKFAASTLIGRGSSTTSDTRPDFVTSGTAGQLDLTGTVLKNFRNVTFTNATTPVDVVGCDIECELLTQASANISDSVVRTSQAANVATLQDPTFGASSDLHDTEFIQGADGVGHAIELDTVASYTLNNIKFTGYGGTPGSNPTPNSGASDAAIVNSSGGAVTINVVGGDSPSVRNTAGSTTTVVNAVDLKVTVKNRNGDLLQGIRVRYEQSNGTLIANGETNASGVFTFSEDVSNLPYTNAKIIIRKKAFEDFDNVLTIPTSGFDIPVTLQADPDVNLP